jgi:hypothetical protein
MRMRWPARAAQRASGWVLKKNLDDLTSPRMRGEGSSIIIARDEGKPRIVRVFRSEIRVRMVLVARSRAHSLDRCLAMRSENFAEASVSGGRLTSNNRPDVAMDSEVVMPRPQYPLAVPSGVNQAIQHRRRTRSGLIHADGILKH